MICTKCRKDLPESAFYPSVLAKKGKQCKTCWNKRSNENQRKKIIRDRQHAQEDEDILFDTLFGGYVITIINHIKNGEYKYTIKTANKMLLQTNETPVFRKKMEEILTL